MINQDMINHFFNFKDNDLKNGFSWTLTVKKLILHDFGIATNISGSLP